MKPPFSLEQFLAVFMQYNEAVFPMQILFYLMGIFAVYLVLKPNAHSDKIINLILAFFWLWMGVVYHFIYFTDINKLAYLFGAFFIVQGLLFVVSGVFQSKFSFRFQADKFGITGMSLIVFALIIYPVLGYFFGHIYPSSPTFGLPCPTTIFTFGFLLLNQKKCPLVILIIPFIWSIIGFMAAFQFGIFEDTGLIVASLLTTFLLLYRNKILSTKQISI
jgi:hypothetical protein